MTRPIRPEGLPANVKPYRSTPAFDQDSLPAGLRREHATRPGVWAVIHVLAGRLRYRILTPPSESLLTPDHPGLVRPEERHEIEPAGPVRFCVTFYKAPETADEAPHGYASPACSLHELDPDLQEP